MPDRSPNSTSPTAIARATGYAPQTVRRALLGQSRLFIVVPANSIMFDRAGRPRVKVGAVLVPSDPRGATYRVVDGGAEPVAGPEGLVARLDAAQAEVAAARDAISMTSERRSITQIRRDDSCDCCAVESDARYARLADEVGKGRRAESTHPDAVRSEAREVLK